MQTDVRDRLQHALGNAYEIQLELTPGGMSRLFLAVERSLGRRVVVKVLPPELASEVNVARFQREIALTAHLQHPHILTILSAGAHEGLLYYIAPYVDGESLRHRLTREGKLEVQEGIRLLRDVADALAYAHARGVIHRDVKPENILIQGDHALLADFGVARALHTATGENRLTGTGMGVGTIRYMAPEQMLPGDTEPDARSDIYALGIVAYEVFAGAPPFAGPTPRDGVVAQFTESAPPVARARADVPRELSDTIARALAFEPDARLETAAAFRDALVSQLSSSTSHAIGSRHRSTRSLWMTGVAVLLVAAALFATRSLWHANAVSAFAPKVILEPANAIAVLPFTNLTPASDNQYFSDGMTEELITALSRVPGLRVVARTSAFAFQGKNASLPEVSAKLHVRTVVEGSIRRAKNRLRVSARLVDAQSGYQVWSEDYDRDLKDVFVVQDEIARAIAGAIGSRLDSARSVLPRGANDTSAHNASSGQLVFRSTQNMEAYDLYLRARAMREQRGEGGLRGSVDLLMKAIQKDSNFADAYAALALTYLILPDYSPISDDSVGPLIRANAARALALNPRAVEAEIALAGMSASAWHWADAESHVRRAIELDPSNAQAHLEYADLLRTQGRYDASIVEHRKAAALDPLSGPIAWNIGITQWNARSYREAIKSAEHAIQIAPNIANAYMVLAIALASTGEADSAAHVIDKLRKRFPESYTRALATWVYGKTGRNADGEAVLEQMRNQRMGVEVTEEELAVAHLGLGHADSALTWIEASIRSRESEWSADFSPCGAIFDPIRSEPRFQAALRRLGISACNIGVGH